MPLRVTIHAIGFRFTKVLVLVLGLSVFLLIYMKVTNERLSGIR